MADAIINYKFYRLPSPTVAQSSLCRRLFSFFCAMPKGGKKSFSPGSSQPQAVAAPQTLQELKPSHQVVVQAFIDPKSPGYLNQAAAYRVAHPRSGKKASTVEGHRVLATPSVRHVVQHELNVRGLDREGVLDELAWNVTTSKGLGKLTEHREAVMASAKVQGFLVDKVESKVIEDKELDTMRRVVADVLEGTQPGVQG